MEVAKGHLQPLFGIKKGESSMKLGIIADIHGNAPALQAVLQELDARQDVDHMYCLGDMIAIGPDTNQVLEMLFTRKDVSLVSGNHDEAVLALAQNNPYPASHVHAKRHHQWVADHIDPAFISQLQQLPRQIHQTIHGHTCLFTHYHIEKQKVDAPIHEDPFSSIVPAALEKMQALFQDCRADVIGFGHHHPVHDFRDRDTVYINPGSLGCQPSSFAPYTILTIEQEHLSIDRQEAVYDKTSWMASYETYQVPERDFLLSAFHGQEKAVLRRGI
ncbi:metallophosphoesterase [uncultured Marinococcus sp.]|uniref:metallophosphoesterase family protein n=1 Tax=uncultured Marinococcus sp. TaxID=487012 RepID=UPI0026028879|nr:metallophosphoesterase family protein [uncultured Marinococcus sp.]